MIESEELKTAKALLAGRNVGYHEVSESVAHSLVSIATSLEKLAAAHG